MTKHFLLSTFTTRATKLIEGLQDFPIEHYKQFRVFEALDRIVGSTKHDRQMHESLIDLYTLANKSDVLQKVEHNQSNLDKCLKEGIDYRYFSYLCMVKGELPSLEEMVAKRKKVGKKKLMNCYRETLSFSSYLNEELMRMQIINSVATNEGRVSSESFKQFNSLKAALINSLNSEIVFAQLSNMQNVELCNEVEDRVYRQMTETEGLLKKEGYPVKTAYDYHVFLNRYNEQNKPKENL